MSGSSYPLRIQQLIAFFSKLPGIGRRSAERMAFGVLNWSDDDLAAFAENLGTLHQVIHPCKVCGNFSEEDVCPICQDNTRNHSVICVVEHPSQITVFEKSGCFNGLYHVLGGKLSPLTGRGPEALRITELRQRLESGKIAELILATSPDVEGEATAHFLAQEFADMNIPVSRIASGVPVGSDLNFADAATLSIAISARRRI